MWFKKNNSSDKPVPQVGAAEPVPEPDLAPEDIHMRSDGDLEKVDTAESKITEYPTGVKLVLIMISIFTSMFLVSLDRMIIATAIPAITNEFHSVDDIGWYGSAFLLTTCACQLLFGKLYTYFSIKTVFLTSVLLFEIGSAICGAAPNSIALIVGRAIAGIGGAGIFSGGMIIIVFSVPLHKRPMYQGYFGAVFSIASVVGPPLGGAFTTEVTWRWCFYINLPLGVVAIFVVIFLLNIPNQDSKNLTIRERLAQLDFYGTALIVPGCVCLILALQWGGLKYDWSNGRIIALLTLGLACFVGFVFVQIFLPKTATLPPRIFKHRSMVAGSFFSFCNGSQMMLFTYYLPIWFQAIQGYSAKISGVQSLPILLPMVASSMLTGLAVRRFGYYTPIMIFGSCLTCIAAGLLTTLKVHEKHATWVGFQILYGWGLGCSMQAPNLAAQTVLKKRDVPIGTSLVFFTQLLGGAVFLAVGQNVFSTQLARNLAHIPGFSAASIESSGATSLVDLPDSIKPAVLEGYNEALRSVFVVGMCIACISVLGAFGMEWRSTNEAHEKAKASDEEAGEVPVTGEKTVIDEKSVTDEKHGVDVSETKEKQIPKGLEK